MEGLLIAQLVKNLPAVQETRVWCLGGEDPLEKEMAIHSSNIAWKIPWIEEPGRLQSMGLQRVGHDWATSLSLSHTSKVMLKILQARLQQYLNEEFPNIQAGFMRQGNKRSNCQHPLEHRKSKRVPIKHLLFLYWLCQSLWLCGSQQTAENSERDGNTKPPDLSPEKPICR